jgi:hypothetical protein
VVKGKALKRKLISALAVATLAAGSVVATTGPAAASDAPGALCNLNSNAWLREWPSGPYLRTLSAGRGFRWHWQGYFDGYQDWFYGHGAEAPNQDGWVLAAHLNC